MIRRSPAKRPCIGQQQYYVYTPFVMAFELRNKAHLMRPVIWTELELIIKVSKRLYTAVSLVTPLYP